MIDRPVAVSAQDFRDDDLVAAQPLAVAALRFLVVRMLDQLLYSRLRFPANCLVSKIKVAEYIKTFQDELGHNNALLCDIVEVSR